GRRRHCGDHVHQHGGDDGPEHYAVTPRALWAEDSIHAETSYKQTTLPARAQEFYPSCLSSKKRSTPFRLGAKRACPGAWAQHIGPRCCRCGDAAFRTQRTAIGLMSRSTACDIPGHLSRLNPRAASPPKREIQRLGL